ncbi:cytochrome b [Thalassotalea agarivorans]|uniref:Cytochrome b561 n=1 Tax=Thalassotalea agarivorans TaxID=349064 RepID=A0A1I0AG25_THASX|nr:cytochrome b [Thalassotalea agarivorans]SES92773.1 cytochrome b561 [Thalassotalea agarivorans]
MLKNSNNGYGLISMLLHWLSAFTVIALFALGLWMIELDYYSSWYKTAPHWHKSIGILLCAATVIRVIFKWLQVTPKALGSKIENRAAHLAHFTLYALLIGLFVSGYLISTADGRAIEVFNWFSIPASGKLFDNQEVIAGDIHKYIAYGLIGLATLHALAALKHHFINKDNTLTRMITFNK